MVTPTFDSITLLRPPPMLTQHLRNSAATPDTAFATPNPALRLVVHFRYELLLAVGGLLTTMSLQLFGFIDESSRYFPGVLLPLIVHAVCFALVIAHEAMEIIGGLSYDVAATASGRRHLDQQIGGALGVAVIAAVFAISSEMEDEVTSQATAFIAASVISLVSALVALGITRGDRSRSTR